MGSSELPAGAGVDLGKLCSPALHHGRQRRSVGRRTLSAPSVSPAQWVSLESSTRVHAPLASPGPGAKNPSPARAKHCLQPRNRSMAAWLTAWWWKGAGQVGRAPPLHEDTGIGCEPCSPWERPCPDICSKACELGPAGSWLPPLSCQIPWRCLHGIFVSAGWNRKSLQLWIPVYWNAHAETKCQYIKGKKGPSCVFPVTGCKALLCLTVLLSLPKLTKLFLRLLSPALPGRDDEGQAVIQSIYILHSHYKTDFK